MRTKKLLLILVIGMILLGACASPPAAPATSPMPQLTPSPTTSTPTPTTTPTPSLTPTGPYTGPLFDTHLHLDTLYHFPQLSRLRSAADLLSYLDRNKVEGAIGFYPLPSDKSRSSWVSSAETIIMGTRSRVIPLLLPNRNSSEFVSGQYSEAVLRQYLQPQGLLQGIGEIALYISELQSVTFDSPVMQTVFKMVNESKGIVMVHPSNTARRGGRPTELAEVEPSIRQYPDAIFLFHGQPEVFNLVVQLMSKYPNVYFTMDAMNWIFTSSPVGYNLLAPEGAAADTAERFLADINRISVDSLLEESFARVAPQLRQYPDRILWGTDLGGRPWHFEESVTDVVISLSRQLIGRLPADIQEKYAYQNAQRVFGRFLIPNP